MWKQSAPEYTLRPPLVAGAHNQLKDDRSIISSSRAIRFAPPVLSSGRLLLAVLSEIREAAPKELYRACSLTHS